MKRSFRFKEYSLIIILLTLLLLPNFCLVLWGDDSITASFLKSSFFLLTSYLYLLTGLIFIRPKFFFLILSPIVLLQFIEVSNVLLFKAPMSTGVFVATLNTNFNEAVEVIMSQYLLLIIAVITVCFYFFIYKKVILLRFTLKEKMFFTTIILGINLSLVARDFYIIKKVHPNSNELEILNTMKYFSSVRFNKTYPLNNIVRVNNFFEYKRSLESYSKNVSNFAFNSKQNDSINSPNTVVLVIGETARSDHFGINGYKRNTTPLLSKQENLLSFNKVYSGANLT